jgi:hypothetical protein
MSVCGCGHDESRHGDADWVYGCSYEPDRDAEPEAWKASSYGVCPCIAFEPAPVPGEPIVFGIHRLPSSLVKWTTEPDSERERRFREWVKGAPGDMV